MMHLSVFEVSACAALLLFIALSQKMRNNKTENNENDDKSEISILYINKYLNYSRLFILLKK